MFIFQCGQNWSAQQQSVTLSPFLYWGGGVKNILNQLLYQQFQNNDQTPCTLCFHTMFIIFIFSSQKSYFDTDKDFFSLWGSLCLMYTASFSQSVVLNVVCNDFLTVINISVSTWNISPPLRTTDFLGKEWMVAEKQRRGLGGEEGKGIEQELAIMFYY